MTFIEKIQEAKKKGFPVYYEGDLICNICSEPWNAFRTENGDMTPEENKKFRKGDGCPRCSDNLQKV